MTWSFVPLALAVAALPAAAQSTQPAPPAAPPAPAVKVGEPAPDFSLPYLVAKADGGFETKQFSLAALEGTKNVVVAFFPAAFSPG
jgi:hypothetical protein